MTEQSQVSQELTTLDHFAPFEAQAKEWMEKASQINVTDESQVELMAGAKEARLALKRIRVSVENTRKELKDEFLRKGNEIQQIANRLRDLIEPIEAHLQEQEDFAKVQEAKRKQLLFDVRLGQLIPLITQQQALMFPLSEMTEFAFETMVTGFKLAKEAKEKYDAEMAEIEIRNKAAKEAEEKRIREENESQQKIIKQQEEKLKKERAERKRLEDEAAARLAKEEADKKQRLAEDRKLKRGPDKNKLLDFAGRIAELHEEYLHFPLKDEDALRIMRSGLKNLLDTANYIKINTDKL